MWDSVNSETRSNVFLSQNRTNSPCFENMQTDDIFVDKENMNLSPLKCDEISMYESNSPVPLTCNTSPTFIRRPLEDHDTNSQDSGYGASYGIENGRFISHASPMREFLSFDTGSLCSMEDEFMVMEEIPELENSSGKTLPQDFIKLIKGSIINRNKIDLTKSPKDNLLKPCFRRSVSLQNNSRTPSSSRVRSCLFKGDNELRNFKRPEPPTPTENGVAVKRSKIFNSEDEENEIPSVPEIQRPILKRAFSATEESIMCAVQRSSTEPDLIGDFSKSFYLPLTNGKHQDMKAITPLTLAQLIKGAFNDRIASFKIIDCRYPYEFEGGHIDGAINIYTKEGCSELLKECEAKVQDSNKRHILIFHCEFSSERGPNLYRHLRKEDRHRNECLYPSLNYPEMYLLEGGYKNFFQQFSEMCVPVAYKEMLHPDHANDLRHFRQKSKTWNMDSRQRPNRQQLKRLF